MLRVRLYGEVQEILRLRSVRLGELHFAQNDTRAFQTEPLPAGGQTCGMAALVGKSNCARAIRARCYPKAADHKPMNSHRLPLAFFAIALSLTPAVRAHEVAAEMAAAASNFLVALTPEQRAKATYDFKDEQRFDWHFIPRPRKGLPIQEMRPDQRPLAHALLASGLSHRGYFKAATIMSLEHVLFEMEGAARKQPRESDLYFVTIFGKPEAAGTWGWRLEGHHLSLNFAIADGKIVGETPSFFGSNPGEVREGPRAGLRVLAAEEDLGRALVKSFDDEQQKIGILAGEAPKEVTSTNLRQVTPSAAAGVTYEKMSKAQRELLEKIIHEFIASHRLDLAAVTWEKMNKIGLEKISFVWAGGLEPKQPHYYRVQGPEFLLEYDNTQNDANHIHTVWRDFTNDFGDDLLQKHYEQSHAK